jgi:DNA-binding NarL/FixJ family response regulator
VAGGRCGAAFGRTVGATVTTGPQRPITVALCDDLVDLRELFREVLEDAGMRVIGEADDGRAGIELAASLHPDVLVLDLEMPVMDGFEAIPLVRERAPHTAIVVLSAFSAAAMADKALQAGAHSYLEKGARLATIVETVRAAADAVPLRPGVQRSGRVKRTTAPGSPSSIHSFPP